jgi:hypothetical protein
MPQVKAKKSFLLFVWLFLGSYRKSDIVFIFAHGDALPLGYVNAFSRQMFERTCLLSTFMSFANYSTLEGLTFEFDPVSGGDLTFFTHPCFRERIAFVHVAQLQDVRHEL